MRLESIKYVEENRGRTLQDLDLIGVLNEMIPLANVAETKINKWDYIKITWFCLAKDMGKN